MITYPLNNIDYTAEDAELYFSTRESGVYDDGDFEVTVSGIDNDVTVGTGIAWIHNTKFSGKVVALKEPKTLTLSLPNSVYDRIDAIVIQFDANDNATNIIVKEGIASSSPVAPAVVRTESLYELHIFHVRRKAGATVISVDNLVDLRNDSNYCGIMFDPISSIDATLTKRGYAADAAETGKQIKKATNVRNLLDNSDFRNPVNQRGQSSYGGSCYTIDRWRTYDGTVDLSAAGLTISHYIRQRMNPLVDGTYTVCARNSSGRIFIRVINLRNGAVTLTGDEEVYACKGDDGVIEIGINAGTWEWAALYEGEYTAENLPPYVAKGYGAELVECERYYREIPAYSSLCGAITGDGGMVAVYHPHSMRINPTVSIDNFNGTMATVNGGKTAVSHISDVRMETDSLIFSVSNSIGSNLNWTPVILRFDNAIRLNADL